MSSFEFSGIESVQDYCRESRWDCRPTAQAECRPSLDMTAHVVLHIESSAHKKSQRQSSSQQMCRDGTCLLLTQTAHHYFIKIAVNFMSIKKPVSYF